MRKVFLFLLIPLLILSCNKDDDTTKENMTVLINQSGSLSVKVIGSDGLGVPGSPVRIYSTFPEGGLIYNDTTDIQGICNVGKLLEGQYTYRLSAERDNRTYTEGMDFQIIAGDNKTLEINPFLNVGDLKIIIVDPGNYPIAGVNVALIPHPKYSNVEYIFDELIAEAYFIEVTDAGGYVSFKGVPAGSPYSTDYSVMAYYDSLNYSYPDLNNSVWTYRNQERSFTIEVSF